MPTLRWLLLALALGFVTTSLAEPMKLARLDSHGDPLPDGALARLGTLRPQHSGSVSAVAFSPDGKILASACSTSNKVVLWEWPGGKEVRRLANDGHAIHAFRFSADGSRLVGVSRHGHLHVWEVSTGKDLLHRQGKFLAQSTCLAFPSRNHLAHVQDARWLRICDLETQETLDTLESPARIRAVHFGPGDQVLAMLQERWKCTLYDLRRGIPIRSFATLLELDVWAQAAISPCGKWLAYEQAAGQVAVAEVATGAIHGCLSEPMDRIESLSFTPDSRYLLLGEFGLRFRCWDRETGRERVSFRTQPYPTGELSPDGTVLALAGIKGDHNVDLWDFATGRRLRDRFHGPCVKVGSISVSPDGRQTATSAVGYDPAITIWETVTGKPLRWLDGNTGWTTEVLFAPSGKQLVSIGGDPFVRVWDPASGRLLRTLESSPAPGYAGSLSMSPDEKFLIATSLVTRDNKRQHTVHVWDYASGRRLKSFAVSSDLVRIHGDGRSLLVCDEPRGEFTLWDLATGQRQRTFTQPGIRRATQFSPDGRWSIDRVMQQSTTLNEVASRLPIVTLPDHDGDFHPVFLPGTSCLAFRKGNSLVVYDWATRKEVRRLESQAPVNGLTASPDGTLLFSTTEDNPSVVVWDVAEVVRQVPEKPAALAPADLAGLWARLLARPALAYPAYWQLVRVPEQAIALLEKQVQPTPERDRKEIDQLIRDLDDDDFETREKASLGLAENLEQAEPILRAALPKATSAEQRRRINDLLEGTSESEHLRSLRAVGVLEQIGTTEARRVLKMLADGAAEATLTQHARQALARLGVRPAKR